MKNRYVYELINYKKFLENEEKSPATVAKYLRDLRAFLAYLGNQEITKELMIAYKKYLQESKYTVSSINSILAAVNKFLTFLGCEDEKVKELKIQQRVYSDADMELTIDEYKRLVETAEADKKLRLSLAIQTMASTGIRVSELASFTVEAVREGEVWISCKNKNRKILLPKALRKKLLTYAKNEEITEGILFRTRNGNAWGRKNIWADMKALCKKANVNPAKVFPHNLRKLFARTFHKKAQDIVKLADVLGHSSMNTTRIYVMSTGKEHQRILDALKLVI